MTRVVGVWAGNGGNFVIHFTYRKGDPDRIGEVAMTGEAALTEGLLQSAEAELSVGVKRLFGQGRKEEPVRIEEVLRTGEAVLNGEPLLSNTLSSIVSRMA